jgi:hypothetical protein
VPRTGRQWSSSPRSRRATPSPSRPHPASPVRGSSPGTVVRVTPFEVFVWTKGLRGATYIERFSRRDGVRKSAGRGAELVNAGPHATVEKRRRNRSDVEKLR